MIYDRFKTVNENILENENKEFQIMDEVEAFCSDFISKLETELKKYDLEVGFVEKSRASFSCYFDVGSEKLNNYVKVRFSDHSETMSCGGTDYKLYFQTKQTIEEIASELNKLARRI